MNSKKMQFYTKGKHNFIQLNEVVFFIVFYLKPSYNKYEI